MAFCPTVLSRVFPNSAQALKYNLDRADASLKELYEERQKKEVEGKTVWLAIRALEDPKTNIDRNGMPRATALRHERSKAINIKRMIDTIDADIEKVMRIKTSFERQYHNSNRASNMSAIRDLVANVDDLDADEIIENIDDVEEAMDRLEESNDRVDDAMRSSSTRVDKARDDALMKEFKAMYASDDEIEVPVEEKTEETATTTTPPARYSVSAPVSQRMTLA